MPAIVVGKGGVTLRCNITQPQDTDRASSTLDKLCFDVSVFLGGGENITRYYSQLTIITTEIIIAAITISAVVL